MKYPASLATGIAAALALVPVLALPQSPDFTPTAPTVDISDPGVYSTVDQRLFNYEGSTQYMAGTNAWWLTHLLDDADVDLVVKQIANSNLKVIRVWGFGSVNEDPGPDTVWFQLLNSTGSYLNYGPNGIPRIDAVVAAASKYNVKLVIPFTNNWGDLGGIPSYNTAFGGNGTTWYTQKKSQAAYRSYVKTLVRRYANSPSVFAWELCNEPRCHGCATDVITTWATEISAFIKGLDKHHLVTLGDEGWFAPAGGVGDGSYAYSGDEGVDFVANLKIPDLDYGVFHLYPDSWGYNYTWGNEWIVQHNAVGAAIGKPVVLEEYGVPFPHNHTGIEVPWQQTVLKNTSLAMDQFWQFGTILASGEPSDWDVNTVWHNDTEYRILATQHAKAMLAKEVA